MVYFQTCFFHLRSQKKGQILTFVEALWRWMTLELIQLRLLP